LRNLFKVKFVNVATDLQLNEMDGLLSLNGMAPDDVSVIRHDLPQDRDEEPVCALSIR
jgi:hypothetical protein